MKKFLALLLCLVVALSAFAACNNDKGDSTSSEDSAGASADSSEEAVSSEDSSVDISEDSSEDMSEDSSVESSDDSIDEEIGTAVYNNGYISFEYPDVCTESEVGGIVTLTSEYGFSIVITSEPATDVYKALTAESYAETILPVLEAQGFEISDVMVEQTTNAKEEEVTVVGYSCTYMGLEMYQTQMIVTAGDTCQVITLTEYADCGDLAQEIFDTVTVLK